MDKDIIINLLRVTVNHLPLVSDKKQHLLVGEVNKMLDKYFADGGKFIKTNISGLLPSNDVNAPDSPKPVLYWQCRKCGEHYIRKANAENCCR